MSKIQIGTQQDQWFNSDGTPTAFGYERLKFIGTLQPLADIPAVNSVTSIDTATGDFTLGNGLARTSQALRASLTSITAALGVNVAMNNSANYFDGPSVAQGAVGTWFVSGTVTLNDGTTAPSTVNVKLWDGTTVIASTEIRLPLAVGGYPVTLSGVITTPAGNLRMSCNQATATTGLIVFNLSGNSKDSTITAVRLA